MDVNKYEIINKLRESGVLYESCPRYDGFRGSIWVFHLAPGHDKSELPTLLQRELEQKGEITV